MMESKKTYNAFGDVIWRNEKGEAHREDGLSLYSN